MSIMKELNMHIIKSSDFLSGAFPSDKDVLLVDERLLSFLEADYSILTEMQEVLYFTEKHAFVSPRIRIENDPDYDIDTLKILYITILDTLPTVALY